MAENNIFSNEKELEENISYYFPRKNKQKEKKESRK